MARQRSYTEIADKLRTRITSGEWAPGQMLPGRRALSSEFNVAAATMERAISVLVAEKALVSEKRRGTFVSQFQDIHTQENLTLPRLEGGHLEADVGIISNVIPYSTASNYEEQWSAQMLKALENQLSRESGITQHFHNLIPEIGVDLRVEDVLDDILEKGIDALVCIACTSHEEQFIMQRRLTIPLIFVDGDPTDLPANQIFIDSVAGGYQACCHLQKRGYGNITYLQSFNANWVESRLRGARLACPDVPLRVYPARTKRAMPLVGTDQEEAGYQDGIVFLKDPFEPGTGFIAPNDAIAKGFIKAAAEKGLEAGKDYGLIGFDNYSREYDLSTLNPPLEEMGREAAIHITRLLKGESVPSRSALKPQLIARKTTRPWGNTQERAGSGQ